MPRGAYQHGMVGATHAAMEPSMGVPRSAFDCRSFHKTTLGAGQLIPILVREVLPGDSFSIRMNALVRLAPMIVPSMDNLALHSWFFFVPCRLLWSHWEEFMGASSTPGGAAVQYLIPTIPDFNNGSLIPGSIGDYFGITNNVSGAAVSCSALPFRAYNQIYNEWFRDTSLVNALPVVVGDTDGQASYIISPIAKAKDYFTTARPYPATSPEFSNASLAWVAESGFTQGPLVPGGRMNLGGQHRAYGVGAPVTGLGVVSGTAPTAAAANTAESSVRTVSYNPHYISTTTGVVMAAGPGNFPDVRVMINDLRTASMIQRYLEADQRFGTNYASKVWAHFRVRTGDARQQRPEFLGGGRSMVTINPVAQTTPSVVAGANFEVSNKMGALAATGYAAASGHGFSGSFTEHGYIIGLVGIRGDRTYQQGIERMWKRSTPFDFYTPETANLGEQAILSSEIFSDGSANDNDVFGYQERWGEYRTAISRTSGYMRSTVATPLDMWHFGDKYAARPVLNPTFLSETPNGSTRALQATAPYSAAFMGDFMFQERRVRPMPMFSIPGAGGRI